MDSMQEAINEVEQYDVQFNAAGPVEQYEELIKIAYMSATSKAWSQWKKPIQQGDFMMTFPQSVDKMHPKPTCEEYTFVSPYGRHVAQIPPNHVFGPIMEIQPAMIPTKGGTLTLGIAVKVPTTSGLPVPRVEPSCTGERDQNEGNDE